MGKIDELEGLRGICAWWVVAGHMVRSVGIETPALLEPGYAVDIFIILSGFVIFLTLDRKQDGWGTFMVRRGFRLFPIYLVALLVSVLALDWQAAAGLGSPFADDRWATIRAGLVEAAREHFWPNILTHLTLTQGIVPPSVIPKGEFAFVGQAWSISLEWQFYLVAPLLFWAVMGRKWIVLALFTAAMVLFQGQSGGAFLPDHMWLFAIGITSYFLMSRERLRPFAPVAVAALAVGALKLWSPALAIWGVVFAALTVRAIPGSGLVRGLLVQPALLALGRMSYSTYILHMIAIFATMVALNAFSLEAGPYRSLFFPLAAGLTLLLSYAGYRWVEAPGIRLGARMAARTQPSMGLA